MNILRQLDVPSEVERLRQDNDDLRSEVASLTETLSTLTDLAEENQKLRNANARLRLLLAKSPANKIGV